MMLRVLSVWFPHLAAEQIMRRQISFDPTCPFVVVGMQKSALRLCSLNAAAEAKGLTTGMALTDARAILPDLMSVTEQPERQASFLTALGRWSERYTPSVALDGADGLMLDVSGCAHLFESENGLLDDMAARFSAMRLTVRLGLADTRGAAWALARFGEQRLSPPGQTRESVARFPVAALRIGDETATTLMRLGLRCISDIDGMPRGALARRFGSLLVQRLDQIVGAVPEPLTPTVFTAPYAVRLSLPDPIGKVEDVKAALNRLLERLCLRLEQEQRGARTLRLSIRRCDGGGDAVEASLARPSSDPARIAPLFDRLIDGLNAGFGIDVVRVQALVTEALKPEQASSFDQSNRSDDALGDMIARIGNRIGFDKVTRFLPAESHIPERASIVAAAAYSKPEPFPENILPRPILLFAPEPVKANNSDAPPDRFRWRGASYETLHANGPERIAPEWWWDDPAWRSGPRDYWRVQTAEGRRLWLFQTHGADNTGWFAQGEFV